MRIRNDDRRRFEPSRVGISRPIQEQCCRSVQIRQHQRAREGSCRTSAIEVSQVLTVLVLLEFGFGKYVAEGAEFTEDLGFEAT